MIFECVACRVFAFVGMSGCLKNMQKHKVLERFLNIDQFAWTWDCLRNLIEDEAEIGLVCRLILEEFFDWFWIDFEVDLGSEIDPKSIRKPMQNSNASWHRFLIVFCRFWLPRRVQNREGISGVAPLGAPLARQVAVCPKKWPHSAPILPPRTENDPKNDPKMCKMTPKVLPEWPGGLREAIK